MAPITYYVSIEGSDVNSGTNDYPFRTIQKASNFAKPGDTILVQPGIYRERISPPIGGSSPYLPITYKSVVPQGAIIRGSVAWKPKASYPLKNSVVYVSPLLDSDFRDTSAIDGPNPFKVPFCVTPYGRNGAPEALNKDSNSDPYMVYTLGQVFVNDIMFTQCPYKREMEKDINTWYYDMSNNQLFVNVSADIIEPNIEITNQRRLFAPHIRGLKNIIVDGFIIERCGNNYPNKFWSVAACQQAGAIGTRCGKFWTIQNNIIRYATGVGIDWGNEGGADQDLENGFNGKAQGANGHVIQNNIISDNGAAGTASFMCKNFMFSGNTVERNNNLKFYGKRRWESAGLKVHCPTNAIIANNVIRNNYCHGVWSDQGAGVNSTFKNNILVGNDGSGINFEIGSSTSGKVTNNIFDKNEYGVSLVTSGGVLIAHNLFLSSTKADMYTNIFNRTADKWDSLNVEILYNIFVKSPQYLQLTVPLEGVASRYMNYNQYNGTSKQEKFQLISIDGKTKTNMTFEKWQNAWSVYNSETNFDDKSYLATVDGTLEECNPGVYNVTMKTIPLLLPYVSRTDITDDYFSKTWNEDNCIAGPFTELSNGCFQLNKSFISNK
jgi:parallel beta-helix repeat protein